MIKWHWQLRWIHYHEYIRRVKQLQMLLCFLGASGPSFLAGEEKSNGGTKRRESSSYFRQQAKTVESRGSAGVTSSERKPWNPPAPLAPKSTKVGLYSSKKMSGNTPDGLFSNIMTLGLISSLPSEKVSSATSSPPSIGASPHSTLGTAASAWTTPRDEASSLRRHGHPYASLSTADGSKVRPTCEYCVCIEPSLLCLPSHPRQLLRPCHPHHLGCLHQLVHRGTQLHLMTPCKMQALFNT